MATHTLPNGRVVLPPPIGMAPPPPPAPPPPRPQLLQPGRVYPPRVPTPPPPPPRYKPALSADMIAFQTIRSVILAILGDEEHWDDIVIIPRPPRVSPGKAERRHWIM